MVGILNPSLFVQYLGQGDDGGPSPRVWSRMVGLSPSPNGQQGGVLIGDDFLNYQGFTNAISGTTALPSTTVPAPDGYQIYVDSATTASGAARLNGVSRGVARLAPGLTANHLAILYSGDIGAISDTSGESHLTIWETRVRLPSQVTTGATFFGLANAACCADGGIIASTGGLIAATGAGVGFQTLGASSAQIRFVYKKNSSGSTQTIISNAKTVTADAWVKLGFVFDPHSEPSKRIRVFVDNVEQGTHVTAGQIAAATFPDGITLGTLLGAMSLGGSVSRLADVDWWYCWQSRV